MTWSMMGEQRVSGVEVASRACRYGISRVVSVVLGGALLSFAASCTTGRSTEAFCGLMNDEQDRLSAQYEDEAKELQSADSADVGALFAAVGMMGGALSDLNDYYAKLSEVAPPEIEEDMARIAEIYDQNLQDLGDNLDNPLAMFGGALVDTVRIAGPMGRVNEFAVENCGRPL